MLPADRYESSGVQDFTKRARRTLEKAWRLYFTVNSDLNDKRLDI